MAQVAADKGARIICYPELFLSPWFLKEENKEFFSLSHDASSDVIDCFLPLSKETGTVFVIPFFETSNGKYYNSAAVLDCGRLLGVYRKIHIPNLQFYREQFYFSPGNIGLPVFETSHGKIGVQICWDNLFPEGSRVLALKGAEIVFAPTAAGLNTRSLWERAISANAFANNIFIFRVNRVGREDDISFYGRSFCVDPWGETISELAGSKDAIVIADIDLKERDAASETWGFLKQRKPAEYSDLIK